MSRKQQNKQKKTRQETATNLVKDLFKDNTPTTNALKDTTTQDKINNVQKAIDAVTDEAVKGALQKDLDKAKSLLNAANVTTGNASPKEFTIGTDKYVTGTYTGDVKKLSIFVNDVEYTGGALKTDGTFSFYAQDKGIKKTDTIFVVTYDKNGKQLSKQQVKFSIITEGKITPTEMTIPGDKNIVGTYTGDVASITVDVDDKEYKGGTVADGTFKFYSQDKIKVATSKVIVKAYDAAGKLLDTKTVKLKAVVAVTKGSVTLDTFTVGDKNITGVYTGDVKSFMVTVGETSYKGGTLNADGTFKFYALDKIKSADEIVTIQALDKVGKVLDTKTVTVAELIK
ncbi:immunoglobulin-like domain-containing protein [Listeria cornellensis]|uniref:immunoglobulin-like domain-containing protein n=1 Tax=Listeria cornellensis TaxID=1494961 RepID=UPI0004B5F15B|nr:immunoglobulin-like domain-containing protein [Listeria cornellensis]